jgi:hypothetical protein
VPRRRAPSKQRLRPGVCHCWASDPVFHNCREGYATGHSNRRRMKTPNQALKALVTCGLSTMTLSGGQSPPSHFPPPAGTAASTKLFPEISPTWPFFGPAFRAEKQSTYGMDSAPSCAQVTNRGIHNQLANMNANIIAKLIAKPIIPHLPTGNLESAPNHCRTSVCDMAFQILALTKRLRS